MKGLVIGLLALALACVSARAEERIALVMGNAAYANIGALPNPGADAQLIADTLNGLGFKTTLVMDADQSAMKQAIVQFGRSLRSAGREAVGLFYYAGHGIQARDRNYLMPIEAAPVDSADLDLMGVEANWVLRQMESAGNRTNIVILDACRNNPFAANDRSVGRGLARIEPPTGSFVAYATAPGSVAVDGDGANSPFTAALASAMSQPGVAIEQVFKQVRKQVIQDTGGQQTPWDSSSLVHDFYFNAAQPQPAVESAELSLWQGVSKSNDPERLALFLQVFPDSQFAPDARALLKALMMDEENQQSAEQEPVADEKPDLSEEEMMALAQATPSVQSYANYLAVYPNGVYADLAKAELAALLENGQQSDGDGQVAAAAPAGALTWEQPLREGSDAVIGWSLSQLVQGKPLFPPIEGLPREVWGDQQCASCHAWSRQALCDQGNFYLGKDEDALTRIPHPYGGGFKSALSRWAGEGCN